LTWGRIIVGQEYNSSLVSGKATQVKEWANREKLRFLIERSNGGKGPGKRSPSEKRLGKGGKKGTLNNRALAISPKCMGFSKEKKILYCTGDSRSSSLLREIG